MWISRLSKFNHIFLLAVTFAFTSVFAAPKSILTEVTAKYRKSALVTIKMTKTVKSNLLGKETKYQGTIYLAPNKFRLNIEEPEKNQIIFDGKTIWNVQFPPKEIPGPVQVAKSKLDNNSKKQLLISTLISKNGLTENFKINKEEKNNSITKIFLVPLKTDLNIKNLEVEVKANKIIAIAYVDDVGNQTKLDLENTEFSKKSSNLLFKYKPPKDAQVTNL